MSDLNAFIAWANEKPTRTVDITINKIGSGKGVNIWVWDTELSTGDFVESVDDIDLEAVKERRERADYEALRAKYEQAS